MTVITNIDQARHGAESIDQKTAKAGVGAQKPATGLFESLERVDSQIAESEGRRAKASMMTMENELGEALTQEFASDEVLAAHSNGATSPRMLELGRRRSTVRMMRHEIENGTAILRTLSQNSDLVLKYFDNSEKELQALEAAEETAIELERKCAELTAVKQKAIVKITDQQKQIHLLEAKKNQAREQIGEIQANFNQARSEIDENRIKMATQTIKVSKLADDLNRTSEEFAALEAHNKELWTQTDTAMAENEQMRGQLAEMQRLVAEANSRMKMLSESKTTSELELKDLTSKYKSLRDKYAEQGAVLEEKAYKLETLTADYEEKCRLKDAHIFKLESEVNVSEKQVMLADDMIASLKNQLGAMRTSSEISSPSPRSVAGE